MSTPDAIYGNLVDVNGTPINKQWAPQNNVSQPSGQMVIQNNLPPVPGRQNYPPASLPAIVGSPVNRNGRAQTFNQLLNMNGPVQQVDNFQQNINGHVQPHFPLNSGGNLPPDFTVHRVHNRIPGGFGVNSHNGRLQYTPPSSGLSQPRRGYRYPTVQEAINYNQMNPQNTWPVNKPPLPRFPSLPIPGAKYK
ncbi:MAG: hypothetical protein QNJ31_02905 [Candidatus Caenarcaniphilales bacterium]|nr:hypothetical protein [Candidatus Caenarcaniphilales bacterium]